MTDMDTTSYSILIMYVSNPHRGMLVKTTTGTFVSKVVYVYNR